MLVEREFYKFVHSKKDFVTSAAFSIVFTNQFSMSSILEIWNDTFINVDKIDSVSYDKCDKVMTVTLTSGKTFYKTFDTQKDGEVKLRQIVCFWKSSIPQQKIW